MGLNDLKTTVPVNISLSAELFCLTSSLGNRFPMLFPPKETTILVLLGPDPEN